jgi:hypothetical protein
VYTTLNRIKKRQPSTGPSPPIEQVVGRLSHTCATLCSHVPYAQTNCVINHDMPPQQRRQGNQGKEEIIEAVLDEVLQAFRTEDVPREIASLAARKLTSLRAPLLNLGISMAATDFVLQTAWSSNRGLFESPIWQGRGGALRISPRRKILYLLRACVSLSLFNRGPTTGGIVGTGSLMANYFENFDRSSEAVCRTALDFVLNECLTVMVSIMVQSWVVSPFTLTSIRKATTGSRKIRPPTITLKGLVHPRSI